MEKSKENRGGARNGAGRPAEELKMVTAYVSPKTAAILDKLRNEFGVSRGKVIDIIIADYEDRQTETESHETI